jgi:cytochrome c556
MTNSERLQRNLAPAGAPRFRSISGMAVVLAAALCAGAGCVPHRDLPPDQIEKLDKLKEVMDVQATVADPAFKKIGEPAYSEQDWVLFADVGSRIQVTSRKAHQFSKGPDFDKLADQLHATAEKLSAASAAKDVGGASGALGEMKATCKECHSRFK